MKEILKNDISDITILYLLVKKNGVLSSKEINSDIDFKLKTAITRPRISHSKRKLAEKGVQAYNSYGLQFQMNPKILSAYQLIFTGLDQLLDELENNKIHEVHNLVKKRMKK